MLNFFDCSCIVGRRSLVNPGSFYRTAELLERMDRYGIGKALVYHASAREYDPACGNDALRQELPATSRLLPVWVILPHHTGEFPPPEQLAEQMKQHGVKAVRMFPGPAEQSFSMAEWSAGELLSFLEHYRIPLLLGANQLAWQELYQLCQSYRNLPLLLTDAGYRAARILYPLLESCPNLRLETYSYKVNDGIADICRRFGAERLVFGSGMPVFSGAAAVSMIQYAEIEQEEKRKIAEGNMLRLLEEVRL